MKLYSIGIILCNEELDKPIILSYASDLSYFNNFTHQNIENIFFICFRTFTQNVNQNIYALPFLYENFYCHSYLQSCTFSDTISVNTKYLRSLEYSVKSKLGITIITDENYPENIIQNLITTTISQFSEMYDGQWQFSEQDFQFPNDIVKTVLDNNKFPEKINTKTHCSVL